MENNLLISDLKYFVGSRKGSGKYSVFSSSMDLDTFKKYCIERLGLESTLNKDNSYLLFNIKALLEKFTQNIVNEIRQQNNNLFNRLLDHNQNGVIRQFTLDYNRIKDGNINENYLLRLEINKLIEHHLSIFLQSTLYKWEIPNYSGLNQPKHVLHIKELVEIFSILINILCMSIMIEYKISKKYFKDDYIIRNNINQIKDHLNKVFLEPIRSKNLDEFYAYCLFKQPNLLEKYLKIQNKNFKINDCYRSIQSSIQNKYGNYYNGHYMEEIEHSVCLLNDKNNVFDQVVDLMGIINMVEFMYDKLKDSCNTDDESNDQSLLVEFEIFFNK